MSFVEFIKIVFLGLIEGITEWLPISSTGHMLLVDEFLQLNASDMFKEMFFYVIQLGAIFAVVVLFWNRMLPVRKNTEGKYSVQKKTISIWLKVIVACIPGGIAAVLFDDYIETYLHTPIVISFALILYGIAFLILERSDRKIRIDSVENIDFRDAFLIGLFQVLSIVPGTSRSGATIIGALLIGVSRVAAAEFTFFLAVPVMIGMSLLKIIKFGFSFSTLEIITLALGMIVAFVTSLAVIRFLMNYIKKHDFKIFGWYRIFLGIVVLLYFLVIR